MEAGDVHNSESDPYGRLRVQPGATLEIFRAVAVGTLDNPALIDSFRSDAELGEDRLGRDDVEYEALSAREEFGQVRDLIRNVARNQQLPPYSPDLIVGNYIATLRLTADHGAWYRPDPPPQGHVSVWGEPAHLAAAVADIEPAWD
jgi:hypothetical protein